MVPPTMPRLGRCVLVIVLLTVGCGESSSTTSYKQQVLQERVQRDMQMREKESVIPPDRRSAFKGLNYYDVDSTYRFVVPFQADAEIDTMMLAENTGRIRAQVRLGSVSVPLPTSEVDFAVFQGADDNPRGRLWIPFADGTNGSGTYKAGRYVDLIPKEGDSVVVDFNRAYNPTCAYNPEFACPLPPDENRIEASIPAGEKTPQFGATDRGGSSAPSR